MCTCVWRPEVDVCVCNICVSTCLYMPVYGGQRSMSVCVIYVWVHVCVCAVYGGRKSMFGVFSCFQSYVLELTIWLAWRILGSWLCSHTLGLQTHTTTSSFSVRAENPNSGNHICSRHFIDRAISPAPDNQLWVLIFIARDFYRLSERLCHPSILMSLSSFLEILLFYVFVHWALIPGLVCFWDRISE